MAYPTFTPPRGPDPGYSVKEEPRFLKAPFGDGYSQTAGDGLNTIRLKVELTWSNLDRAERDAIRGFLRQQRGHKVFWYTLPDESSARKWTAPKWRSEPVQGTEIYTLKATFEEDFRFG